MNLDDFTAISNRINTPIRTTATHMSAAAVAIVAVEAVTGSHTATGSWAIKVLAVASALGLYAAKSPGRRIAEHKLAKLPAPTGDPIDAGNLPWGTPPQL